MTIIQFLLISVTFYTFIKVARYEENIEDSKEFDM